MIRPEIDVGDIALLFEQLQAVEVGGDERARELRHRYLALILDGLHLPNASELPSTPPSWDEISRRYGP